jgi:hypothetical protein
VYGLAVVAQGKLCESFGIAGHLGAFGLRTVAADRIGAAPLFPVSGFRDPKS